MAVQDILEVLTGEYTATGIYSFEFRTAKGQTITEIPMLLPPEAYRVQEKWRSNLIPTVGGGYHADFGNDFKDITVTGSSHFFFAGSVKNGSTVTRESPSFVTGFQEFMKLRFIVSRYRDYTMTPGGSIGKFILPLALLSNPNLVSAVSLGVKVQSYVNQQIGALTDRLEMYWHSYDDDDHFKVKLNSLDTSRSKADPYTVNFTISMSAYEVDPARTGLLPSGGVRYERKQAPQEIKKVLLYTGDLAPAVSPSTLPVKVPGDTLSIPVTNIGVV